MMRGLEQAYEHFNVVEVNPVLESVAKQKGSHGSLSHAKERFMRSLVGYGQFIRRSGHQDSRGDDAISVFCE